MNFLLVFLSSMDVLYVTILLVSLRFVFVMMMVIQKMGAIDLKIKVH